ncbi:MAG: flagellar export chaperone FliS [Myxococcales bacterium]|nr:flagellar export chaperone FliS [Myxococcales bacterium]
MHNPYQSSRVLTADRGQLLLMLYDGALRFNGQAVDEIGRGQYLKALPYMRRVMAIVQELSAMLDHSRAPEICANLERLYQFVLDRIVAAQTDRSAKPLADVTRILGDLRQTWQEALEKANDKKPMERTG